MEFRFELPVAASLMRLHMAGLVEIRNARQTSFAFFTKSLIEIVGIYDFFTGGVSLFGDCLSCIDARDNYIKTTVEEIISYLGPDRVHRILNQNNPGFYGFIGISHVIQQYFAKINRSCQAAGFIIDQ